MKRYSCTVSRYDARNYVVKSGSVAKYNAMDAIASFAIANDVVMNPDAIAILSPDGGMAEVETADGGRMVATRYQRLS